MLFWAFMNFVCNVLSNTYINLFYIIVNMFQNIISFYYVNAFYIINEFLVIAYYMSLNRVLNDFM